MFLIEYSRVCVTKRRLPTDDVKLALAKIESQESILLSRLKVYAATAANDDDSLQLEKLLVDLLVLILTGGMSSSPGVRHPHRR